jgi:hypothetical protein
MANDRIYFSDKNDSLDYFDLEQEILRYLRPAPPVAPVISPEIMKQINDVRDKKFEGQSIFNQRF